jgi:copper homeostasis protein (lipoprotein)
MKSLFNFLIFSILCVSIFSCQSGSDGDDEKTGTILKSGNFVGDLPCADCDAIRIHLNLDNKNYVLRRKYLGKDNKVIEDRGKWSFDKKSQKLRLKSNSPDENPHSYLWKNGSLVQLDEEEMEIKGTVSGSYVLTQKEIGIAETPWKIYAIYDLSPDKNNMELPHILIDAQQQKISGYGGCNRFNGPVIIKGDNEITIDNLAMTKRACLGPNVENEFMEALRKVKKFSIKKEQLHLVDEQGEAILKFRADWMI